MEIDIIKYLVSKGHFCPLSEGLYPRKGTNDCALALYFNINKKAKKTTVQFQLIILQQI